MADEVVGRRRALKVGGLAAVGAVGAGAAALVPQTASAAPMSFNPITPYRSLDTRYISGLGKLSRFQTDDWDLWTDAWGNGRIPSHAGAVTYNLTVTETEGAGNLAVYPAGAAYPGVSSINWVVSNLDIANAGTVALGVSSLSGAGSVQVYCDAGATHYIIDVTGYYA